jgi:hypothetical protein
MDKVFEEFNSLSVVFELPEKRLLLKANAVLCAVCRLSCCMHRWGSC